MHRSFAANTYYSFYHNIDIFVTRCYMVVRLDYDSPQALMKTIVLDFARAIVYVYVSLSASELVPFVAEVALSLDREQTGG